MPHTNPLRMTVDLGMILAFTLTALFALAATTIPALAGKELPAAVGSHAVTAAGKGAVSIEPDLATATIGVEVLRPTVGRWKPAQPPKPC